MFITLILNDRAERNTVRRGSKTQEIGGGAYAFDTEVFGSDTLIRPKTPEY